jgi:hypothetical protein
MPADRSDAACTVVSVRKPSMKDRCNQQKPRRLCVGGRSAGFTWMPMKRQWDHFTRLDHIPITYPRRANLSHCWLCCYPEAVMEHEVALHGVALRDRLN